MAVVHPGGVFGVENSLPKLVSPGQLFQSEFNYVLPPTIKVAFKDQYQTPYCNTYCWPGGNDGSNVPANINLIGYVTDLGEDPFNSPILNAVTSPLWDLTNVNELNSFKLGWTVSPNPFIDQVTLSWPKALNGSFQCVVLNSLGQVLMTQTVNAIKASEDFDLSNLAAGLYTLSVLHQNKNFHLKILKQ